MQSVKSYNVNFFQSHNRWTLELGGLDAKGARKKYTTITQHHTSIYPQTKTEPRLWPSLALSVMLPVVLQLSCLGGASSDWSLLEVFISHFIPLNHLYRNPESFNLSQWWFGSSWDK